MRYTCRVPGTCPSLRVEARQCIKLQGSRSCVLPPALVSTSPTCSIRPPETSKLKCRTTAASSEPIQRRGRLRSGRIPTSFYTKVWKWIGSIVTLVRDRICSGLVGQAQSTPHTRNREWSHSTSSTSRLGVIRVTLPPLSNAPE